MLVWTGGIVFFSLLLLKVLWALMFFLRKKTPQRPFRLIEGPLPDELRGLVIAEAVRRWKITPADFDRDLTAELRIVPREIDAFLESLEERYGLVMPDDGRKKTSSISGILSGLWRKVLTET